MISFNALSIYILQNEKNDVGEQNFRSVQDAMRLDESAGSKFKRVSMDLPNLAVTHREQREYSLRGLRMSKRYARD